MPVSAKTYEQVALEDPEVRWELHNGYLRQKPDMTIEHNRVAHPLGFRLSRLLNAKEFDVCINTGRAWISSRRYYIPDVFVVPAELVRRLRVRPGSLEVYNEPLPLVVEVWSPSTGDYDVDEKLPEYQRRGDREIWRIHPCERTLTAWRRQPDGTYTETLYQGGAVQPVALPDVSIDLDMLFE